MPICSTSSLYTWFRYGWRWRRAVIKLLRQLQMPLNDSSIPTPQFIALVLSIVALKFYSMRTVQSSSWLNALQIETWRRVDLSAHRQELSRKTHSNEAQHLLLSLCARWYESLPKHISQLVAQLSWEEAKYIWVLRIEFSAFTLRSISPAVSIVPSIVI